MIGAGGLVVSIVFAVGAILDWAVTRPSEHGFNINKVGWILMIVGVIGAVVSIIVTRTLAATPSWTTSGKRQIPSRVDSTY